MTKERGGWAKAQRCPTSKASVGFRRLSLTYSANENCGLACDVAVWVTQEGQLIHGGWGYGEEYAISRYVVDALVLPIFEGGEADSGTESDCTDVVGVKNKQLAVSY